MAKSRKNKGKRRQHDNHEDRATTHDISNRTFRGGGRGNNPFTPRRWNHRSTNNFQSGNNTRPRNLSNALTVASSHRSQYTPSSSDSNRVYRQSSPQILPFRSVQDLRHQRYRSTVSSILSEGMHLKSGLNNFLKMIRHLVDHDPNEMDWVPCNQTIFVNKPVPNEEGNKTSIVTDLNRGAIAEAIRALPPVSGLQESGRSAVENGAEITGEGW